MEVNVHDMFLNIALDNNLDNQSIDELWHIIKNICSHPEFIKRCMPPYYHHDKVLLGEHILRDTIITYKISKKINSKKDNININNAIYIAMFHDLYELPWQNNPKHKGFVNLHGFTHPIEAIVNAISWYPEYFKDSMTSFIIIDGVIHHMYPLAVRVVDDKDLYLNNIDKYNKLPKRYQDMLKLSTGFNNIGKFSLKKSLFIEGRVLAKADKMGSVMQELKPYNWISLITGHNKKIIAHD